MAINSRHVFGAEIQYFRTDPRYWRSILMAFKSAGLQCVTTYVQWGTHAVGEPDADHPAGVLDFTGETNPRLNLIGFLDLIEELELDLNFRCGPFCCNEMVYGGYPSWLVIGDPNLMVWDYQNRMTQGYWAGKREGSQPSYLHPEYLNWCRRWIGEVDKIIRPHLKSNGGCITMINLDNEISYIVQDSMLASDYNPVNVSRGGFYHQFLKEKYIVMQNIPYKQTVNQFEDILAPRQVPEEIDDNIAWYLDWMEFKEWCMCRYIRELRAMHEANGVRDVLFMTNLNPHLPEGVPTRMPAFEQAVGGIVGYDFYRSTFLTYSGYQGMARVLKLMNASLNYTWSAEFMAGTWNRILPSRVSDDHMRFMARCALAHGCKAIAWFMFHDRDCWGDAPVSSHGHRRPSWAVLQETIDLCFHKINNWDDLVPQMDTAVIYDLIQHRHTAVGDPMPCNDQVVHVGLPLIGGVQAGIATQEYIGLFRLVEQAGYQAGAVDILARPNLLNDYCLAFLPGSPLIERQASRNLRNWINSGGTLVISGQWPNLDENGKNLQFLDLDKPESCSIGLGRVIWQNKTLCATTSAEQDDFAAIQLVKDVLINYGSKPHVHITVEETVSWVDWKKEGGGHELFVQPRNLGSAILHRTADGRCVLFVLNHYPVAVRFSLQFAEEVGYLQCLDTNHKYATVNNRLTLDVDRKSANDYLVHQGQYNEQSNTVLSGSQEGYFFER